MQTPTALAAAHKTAEVVEYSDCRIVVRHAGADLNYRLFDKERRGGPAAIVENKFFGPLLAEIREQQIRRAAGAKPRKSLRPAIATLARKPSGCGRRSGPALRDGSAPAQRQTGAAADISKWLTRCHF